MKMCINKLLATTHIVLKKKFYADLCHIRSIDTSWNSVGQHEIKWLKTHRGIKNMQIN